MKDENQDLKSDLFELKEEEESLGRSILDQKDINSATEQHLILSHRKEVELSHEVDLKSEKIKELSVKI